MKNAVMCGIDFDKVYKHTPAELKILIEAYVEKKIQEQKNIIINAWYTAYFQRCKKLPDLKKILDKIDSKQAEKTKSKKKVNNKDLFERMSGFFNKK